MDPSLKDVTVGFIGGGNMASAMADGLVRKGLVRTDQILVSAPSESTLDRWKAFGARTTHDNGVVAIEANVVFLAFKPHQLDAALLSVSEKGAERLPSKLFVSVLAGVTNEILYKKLTGRIGGKVKLIRAIPNTASSVGEGFAGIAPHSSSTAEDLDLVKKIFACLGRFQVVPEYLIGSIGALAGSGIAYIYMIIEALSDGGVKQGLPRDISTTAAAQTLIGAAKMILETKKHPGQLKDEVCSPGGTTICGVHVIEKGGVRAALIDAIEAGVKRGEEIGKKAAENM